MVSFPITLPPKGIREVRFGLERNQAVTRDPYALTPKILHRFGDGWRAEIDLVPMDLDPSLGKAVADDWITALMSLQGQVGTFYLGDPRRQIPRGSAGGVPLVDGAGQTGTTLNTKGWPLSQTGILLGYDYIEVEARLYMVIAAADSDGTGNSALSIEPAMRSSPADNAPITTINPRAIMMLDNPDVFWTEKSLHWEGLSFVAVDRRQ